MDIENLINKATDDITSLSRKELESLCRGMLKANMSDRPYDDYLLKIAVQLARENAALTVQLESLGETPWAITPGTGKAKIIPLHAGIGR